MDIIELDTREVPAVKETRAWCQICRSGSGWMSEKKALAWSSLHVNDRKHQQNWLESAIPVDPADETNCEACQ